MLTVCRFVVAHTDAVSILPRSALLCLELTILSLSLRLLLHHPSSHPEGYRNFFSLPAHLQDPSIPVQPCTKKKGSRRNVRDLRLKFKDFSAHPTRCNNIRLIQKIKDESNLTARKTARLYSGRKPVVSPRTTRCKVMALMTAAPRPDPSAARVMMMGSCFRFLGQSKISPIA
jgi:hypothetical protein